MKVPGNERSMGRKFHLWIVWNVRSLVQNFQLPPDSNPISNSNRICNLSPNPDAMDNSISISA